MGRGSVRKRCQGEKNDQVNMRFSLLTLVAIRHRPCADSERWRHKRRLLLMTLAALLSESDTYELVETLGSTKTSGTGTDDEGLYFGGRHVVVSKGGGLGGGAIGGEREVGGGKEQRRRG